MIYGYAQVSTDGQSVEAQVRQLIEAGRSRVFPRNGKRRQDRPHTAPTGRRGRRPAAGRLHAPELFRGEL